MTVLATQSSTPRPLCTFRADCRLYGIDLGALQEISTNTTTTPVPPAPPVVRGLTNLRSRVLLVIDFRALLGLPALASTADSRLLVLKPDVAGDVGILVDEGGDILRVDPNRIESWKSAGEEDASFVTGVCRLDDELLMIVDVGRVVERIGNSIRGDVDESASRDARQLSREVNS